MQRTVYKLVEGKPSAVTVKLGISDSIFTEVLEGLNEGDQVITGTTTPQPESSVRGTSSPFGGGGGRRGRF
jgi:HlyD family secretion protein